MIKHRDNHPIRSDGTYDLTLWLTRVLEHRSEEDKTLLRQAVSLAETKTKDLKTELGTSCFYQSLVMGDLLFQLGLDIPSISAALLYETFRYDDLTDTLLRETAGDAVTQLVLGVHKMQALHPSRDTQQSENLRRLLLAVVEDVRVVLIKLAEFTVEMRTVAYLDDDLKKQYALEAQEIYAPLANRLGIGQIKWELEDLTFRFLEPEPYKTIAKLLDERRPNREAFIETTITEIETALKEQGIKAVVKGRAKHIYSIWKKMQRKSVSYNEIYDVHAIRIIADSINECYAALGVVHTLWRHIPKEFDDYIANPKANGYRSLHTAVMGPYGKTLEVQIRTKEMHEQAELGVAAHWRYKEEGTAPQDNYFEKKLASLRQVLKWQAEWSSDLAENEALKREVFQDRVYVLTPKGKILDLSMGATVLDFAYLVHTDIGNHCRGAKINGRIVPLTTALKSGDQVEIITTKTGGPSRDWLNPQFGYLKTLRARTKVHQWFKRQDREQNINEGREVLERELQRLGVENINFDALANQLKMNKVEDMLAQIGAGDIRITQVLSAVQALVAPLTQKQPRRLKKIPQASKTEGSVDVIVAGVGNLLCQMARCCKPVPGDDIIGYLARGRGVSVHRKDCVNIVSAKEKQFSRLIQVEWGGETRNQYAVEVVITSHDRPGLLRDITSLLAAEKVNVVDIQLIKHKHNTITDLKLALEISGIELLSKLFKRIQQLPNVISIKRQ